MINENRISKEETRELLEQLVAIPSPYFKEDRIMDFALEWFRGRDIPAKIQEYHEEKVTGFHGKNLIVEMKGSKEGPVIHLNGHLDTVNLCQGWTRDPWGEAEGDRLYGVGALDMKSGCAAAMLALKAFQESCPVFKGKIKASFVSVEEGPYGMGTNALIESGFLSDDIDSEPYASCASAFRYRPGAGGYGLRDFETPAHRALASRRSDGGVSGRPVHSR